MDADDTAIAFAAAGFRLFPCLPGSKTPACKWADDASTDITQWLGKGFNWATSPAWADMGVIDTDGVAGETALNTLPELPATYTIATPRGGLHRWFKGTVPQTAWAPGRKRCLGEHIDTRGIGSYVLLPGSTITDYQGQDAAYNGKSYELLEDRDIAALPAWVTARLAPRTDAVGAAVEHLDDGGNVTRAIHLLRDCIRRGDVAVSGRGGNNRTYELACEVLNLGLTSGKTIGLLLDLWNPACQPPWSHDELSGIVNNAAAYAQNEAGAFGAPPAAEVFGQIAAPAEKRSRFYFEDEAEQEQGKDPTWLIQDLLPECATCLMVGRSGAYKSFLALDMALSMSVGTTVFGSVPKTGATFYGALEGKANIKKARRRAWKIGHQIESVPDFYVGTAPIIGMPGEMQEFCEQVDLRCNGKRPKLIVLDTLSKCMAGLNENDAGDASKFIRFCDGLVESFGCSVLAIHHTGKDESRGARGSSAFYAGFDTVLEVKAHRETKAVEVWVRKHKDAEERETPWTFEGHAVAGSLVFYPTTPEDHRAATAEANPYDRTKVGSSLRQLSATDATTGVTTRILASTLIPPLQTETFEEREAKLDKAEHALRRLAKSTLLAYCDGIGRNLVWFLASQ